MKNEIRISCEFHCFKLHHCMCFMDDISSFSVVFSVLKVFCDCLGRWICRVRVYVTFCERLSFTLTNTCNDGIVLMAVDHHNLPEIMSHDA